MAIEVQMRDSDFWTNLLPRMKPYVKFEWEIRIPILYLYPYVSFILVASGTRKGDCCSYEGQKWMLSFNIKNIEEKVNILNLYSTI